MSKSKGTFFEICGGLGKDKIMNFRVMPKEWAHGLVKPVRSVWWKYVYRTRII